MTDLSLVDTIVIVMLENRSFDHMLGHLSFGVFANGTNVEGLKAPLQRKEYENIFGAETYYPFTMKDGALASDLPHERREVAMGLAQSAVSGQFTMSGFVKAYFEKTTTNRTLTPDPMGFMTPADVPITRFFADNYAVCDHWFAPLPASTQPNRLMALSGNTRIDQTSGIFPPTDPLVIDWLEARGVRWRVYHCGISFFALLGRLEIFGPNFRTVDRLAADVAHEAPGDFPQVIIVEPSYGDAPHIGSDLPNDNHPPLPVAPGETFLRQVYEALTCNPDRWSKTVMIVAYDEHGGFFDHVPPPLIPYKPAANATFTEPFTSLGLRIPGLIVSPLVSSKSVFNKLLDHTSILQFIAEKFAQGKGGYSSSVEERRNRGIGSVAQALDLSSPRTDIPSAPPAPLQAIRFAGPAQSKSAMQQAFEDAAKQMVKDHPRQTAQRYPEISHWVLTQAHANP